MIRVRVQIRVRVRVRVRGLGPQEYTTLLGELVYPFYPIQNCTVVSVLKIFTTLYKIIKLKKSYGEPYLVETKSQSTLLNYL